MGTRQKFLAVFLIFAVYKLNPLYIRSSILGVASSFSSNLAPAQDPRSLKVTPTRIILVYIETTPIFAGMLLCVAALKLFNRSWLFAKYLRA